MSSTAKLLKIPSNFAVDDVIDPQRSYSRSFEPKILCFGFEMLKIQNQYKVNTENYLPAITGKGLPVRNDGRLALKRGSSSNSIQFTYFQYKKMFPQFGQKTCPFTNPQPNSVQERFPSFFRNRNDDALMAMIASWQLPSLQNVIIEMYDFQLVTPSFTTFFQAHG